MEKQYNKDLGSNTVEVIMLVITACWMIGRFGILRVIWCTIEMFDKSNEPA
jgi:hypothetical protein